MSHSNSKPTAPWRLTREDSEHLLDLLVLKRNAQRTHARIIGPNSVSQDMHRGLRGLIMETDRALDALIAGHTGPVVQSDGSIDETAAPE